MKLMKEMPKAWALVKALLEVKPHLRDHDKRLMANIWRKEVIANGYDPKVMPLDEFLTLFVADDNKITNPETIRRTRQKVQEKHPELEGKFHKNRQEAGGTVRKNIKAA